MKFWHGVLDESLWMLTRVLPWVLISALNSLWLSEKVAITLALIGVVPLAIMCNARYGVHHA